MATKQEIRDKIKSFSHEDYDSTTKSSRTDTKSFKERKEARAPKDKMTKAIDAETQKQGGKARGTYGENAGGGTPGTGGRGGMHSDGTSNAETRDFIVADSKDDPVAQKAKDAGIPVRYAQPRDENGQFTYNSANNRKLSTKYSRGHTLPPFLKGVDLTFIKKGTEFQYTDKDGKLVRVISSIDMTPEELKNACKKYLETEGGFAAIVGTAITKHGAPSKTAKTGIEGKVGDLDVSKLRESTQEKLDNASQLKDQKWIDTQMGRVMQPTTPRTPRTPVGAGAGTGGSNLGKNELNNEKLNVIREAISKELPDITNEEIQEMYEKGILSDDNFEDELRDAGLL